jgi:hypothetical protein
MYDQSLNSAAALAKIGQVEGSIDYVFREEDPLTMTLKSVRQGETRAREFIAMLSALDFFDAKKIPIAYGYEANLDIGYFYSSTIEVLINSIEHGSDFGSRGQVRLQAFLGHSGLALFVDDPGSGYDPLAATPPEGGRGHGIFSMRESELFMHDRYTLGTEKIEGGFRTILVYERPV